MHLSLIHVHVFTHTHSTHTLPTPFNFLPSHTSSHRLPPPPPAVVSWPTVQTSLASPCAGTPVTRWTGPGPTRSPEPSQHWPQRHSALSRRSRSPCPTAPPGTRRGTASTCTPALTRSPPANHCCPTRPSTSDTCWALFRNNDSVCVLVLPQCIPTFLHAQIAIQYSCSVPLY